MSKQKQQTQMNPTLLIASIVAAIASSAQAGYVYMYSPFAATQCRPGNVCPISWHVSHDGPQFDRIDIELLAGEAHSAHVVAPIVLGYDLSQGNTYLWNVPQGVLPDGDYFIRIKGVGTDYQSYSHSFPIALEHHDTVTPVPTATGTATETATGTVIPTRTGSILSSISTAIKSKTTAAETSSSSAMSVQGSVSVAAAVVAAAFAVMMF